MYTPVKAKADFPSQEEEILKYWRENDTFQKSMKAREGAAEFSFYDGPPFATGLPHFGHFIPSTIKDIIPRYKTMRGYHVERRFGWDCHGLPVENLIEKELGINSKHEIEKYGVAAFNEKCRASVLKYTTEWRKTIERMGRWVDFDDDYKTMDAAYMESIWAVAKLLWDKGLIYEGRYVLPYCPRCSTVLSTHELSQGYKERKDPAVTVKFLAVKTTKQDKSAGSASSSVTAAEDAPIHGAQAAGGAVPEWMNELADGNTYYLAWTTTPWTLPSNEGLCMGPDVDYSLVKDNENGERYIMATARLSAYYKEEKEYTVLWERKGAEFIGAAYQPLFPYFARLADEGAFRLFNAAYVSTEDGTGIVHIAPAFGEEDSKVFQGTGIEAMEPMDAECRFTEDVADYAGRFVKDCDEDIIKHLKAEKKLVRKETVLHQYPHCWRCGSPLIYRGIGSWFVRVADYHDRLLKANSQIKWQPAHIKEGRFGKWLAGARDWAVSRGRYWGNPIPIWRCDKCKKTVCIGSRDELKTLSGTYPEDLHKQFVDKITFPCECGGTMRRISEVFDCWFESGSMPYAQEHWPFENKEKFPAIDDGSNNGSGKENTHKDSGHGADSGAEKKRFPADFISEGLDQTRGWFYTLVVLAAHLFDEPSFRNCIVSGIVLASDGRKMSKSLRNYTDPVEAISKFSADAIRLFLMHSGAVRADEIRYSDDGVRDVIKSFALPLWSSYSFFVQYANIDGITCTGHEFDEHLPVNPLDRWVLSVSARMVQDVTAALDDYDLSGAIDPMFAFIEDLNNWYIRRSRRRFWRSGDDSDKRDAYSALYATLKTFALVAAPLVPFITEEIWQNLRTEDDKESVHLADWPVANEAWRDSNLEYKMAAVQKAVSMGRSLRNEFNIKNRQPLESVALVTRDAKERSVLSEMEDSIKEELNVKRVIFHEKEDELVEYRAKANFRALGKELGGAMKEVAGKIAALGNDEIAGLIDGATLAIDAAGKSYEIDLSKVIVERIEKDEVKVINDGTLTVGLDTRITQELKAEGLARDLVRGVQNMRKEAGLDITDRINLVVGAASSGGDSGTDSGTGCGGGNGAASLSAELEAAFSDFRDFISGETLAVKAQWGDAAGGTRIETDGGVWMAKIEKA